MGKLALVLVLTACAASAQPSLKDLDFLAGEWAGQGDGTPGAGQGEYSFRWELNKTILVRRSFNQLAKERHEDFLVVFLDAPGAPLKATYWDNEGHTIHYLVQARNNVAVFESEPGAPGPRYRLTYTGKGRNLEGKFELAEPPGVYKTYLTWTSHPK